MNIRTLFFLTFFCIIFSTPVLAESIFVAQTSKGDSTGTNSTNAHSIEWFNDATNWGVGLNKISAGDKVFFIGEISSAIKVRGSGGKDYFDALIRIENISYIEAMFRNYQR